MQWPDDLEDESWQEFSDPYGEANPKQTLRKRKKRPGGDEDDDSPHSGRSGKPFHRTKSWKDMNWE